MAVQALRKADWRMEVPGGKAGWRMEVLCGKADWRMEVPCGKAGEEEDEVEGYRPSRYRRIRADSETYVCVVGS